MKISKSDSFQTWLDEQHASTKSAVMSHVENTLQGRTATQVNASFREGHISKIRGAFTGGRKDLFIFKLEQLKHEEIVFGLNGEEAVLLGTVPHDKGDRHNPTSETQEAYQALGRVLDAYRKDHPPVRAEENHNPNGLSADELAKREALANRFASNGGSKPHPRVHASSSRGGNGSRTH